MNNPLPPEAKGTAEINDKYTKIQGIKTRERDSLENYSTIIVPNTPGTWKVMCMPRAKRMLSKDLRRS